MVEKDLSRRYYEGELVLVKYEDNCRFVWYYDIIQNKTRWFCVEEIWDELDDTCVLDLDRYEAAYTQDLDKIIYERGADFEGYYEYEEFLPKRTKVSRRYT